MKPRITTLFLIFSVAGLLSAQDPILISSFRNTTVVSQDSLIVISTVGSAFEFAAMGNGILLTSQPLIFTVEEDTTSVHSISRIEGLSLFPNPVYDLLILAREQVNAELEIELFQPDGKRLQKLNWEKGIYSFQLSMAGYSAGSYLLVVRDQHQSRQSSFKIFKPQ